MTTVTVAEARENLPDLLRRAAAGEQIVITEGGKWLAALGAPPPAGVPLFSFVRSPEEEAARQARAESLVREWLKLRDDAPVPKPEGMSYEAYIEQYQEQE